ncbi:glycosyltransferase [Eubacterium sp. 1001713B170207_170306_E7]|uniref:glycosyltransferase n=1 Tax=Eubacterium sp. 1001713B170207_170306_E7 TaxID=2787097 RepID=UPI00189A07F7|nr:glycosyltransferase [Eubacterium sp. 1001713B170207_170306_E7]
MKILLIVDDYSGGAGNMAQLLAKHGKDYDMDISLLFLWARSRPRYRLEGITCFENRVGSTKKRIGPLLGAMAFIRRTVSAGDYDAVISFITNNSILAVLGLIGKRIPVIAAERSNVKVQESEGIWRFLRRFAYRRADRIAVQFENFRDFDRGRFVHKTMVIPNIIEEAPAVKAQRKKKADQPIQFVTFSRLAKVKQLDQMILCFKKINEENPNTRLKIYGEGRERKRLEEMLIRYSLEDVVFLKGKIRNPYPELLKSDIYLMTSEQEGFPNALGEAMAVGLPSVVFGCHRGIEALLGCGGFVVKAGDNQEFVRRALLLCESSGLREKMGGKACERSKAYGPERVMEIWKHCVMTAIRKEGKASENSVLY